MTAFHILVIYIAGALIYGWHSYNTEVTQEEMDELTTKFPSSMVDIMMGVYENYKLVIISLVALTWPIALIRKLFSFIF